jgi:hypothetical protein
MSDLTKLNMDEAKAMWVAEKTSWCGSNIRDKFEKDGDICTWREIDKEIDRRWEKVVTTLIRRKLYKNETIVKFLDATDYISEN